MGQSLVVFGEVCRKVDVNFKGALSGTKVDTIVVIHPASHHYTA